MARGRFDPSENDELPRDAVDVPVEVVGDPKSPAHVPARTSTSVFAAFQPRYASLGVATFPMQLNGRDKKPMVSSYAKVGLSASRQLAAKFPAADGFAFCAGERSRITILDIDVPDEDLLQRMLERHGETPAIVRTPSGGFHLLYRWNGEARLIRPWAEPVDLIGAGVAVAAPSVSSQGRYAFVRGSVEDLRRLPPMRHAARVDDSGGPAPRIGVGGREKALFGHLMRNARHCDTVEDLHDVAVGFVELELDRTDGHLFTDAEIERKVAHVWRMTLAGSNFFGSGGVVAIANDIVDGLRDPHAFFLYATLRRHHADRREFAVANAMATSLGWSLPRFQKARRRLVEDGLITVVRRGGRGSGDPPVFTWP